LGFTIGPLLGGFFYQISPDLPYWFTFAIYLPLLVFVMRQRRGEKQRLIREEIKD
jgi:MFS family permease